MVTLIFIHSFSIKVPLLQYFLAEAFMLRSLGFPFFLTPQAWSLYVEILFYAVVPLFVLMASRRPITWALVALVVFSLADVIGPPELGLWKYFCFGVIAAEIIDRVALDPIPATLLALCGTAIMVHDLSGGADWIAHGVMKASAGTIRITGGNSAYTLMLGVGVTVLLIGAVKAPTFRRVMESFPLRALGAVSYSLFMWHGLLVVANLPVSFNGRGSPIPLGAMPVLPAWYMPAIVIPGMIAFASISYVLIERPFLLMRSKAIAPKATDDRSGADSRTRHFQSADGTPSDEPLA
jgi:peptidoglycan/LPS O-acetylase OafA/YrhL